MSLAVSSSSSSSSSLSSSSSSSSSSSEPLLSVAHRTPSLLGNEGSKSLKASLDALSTSANKRAHPELTSFLAHIPLLGDWYCAGVGEVREADPSFCNRVVARTMAIAAIVLLAGFPPTSAATILSLKVPYVGAFVAGFVSMDPLVQYAAIYLGVSSSVAAYIGGVHILATAAKLALTTSSFFSAGAAVYFATLIGAGVFCLMKAHELPSAGLIEHWRTGEFWSNPRNVIATNFEKESAKEEMQELQKQLSDAQRQLNNNQAQIKELNDQLQMQSVTNQPVAVNEQSNFVQLNAQLREKVELLNKEVESLHAQLRAKTQTAEHKDLTSESSSSSSSSTAILPGRCESESLSLSSSQLLASLSGKLWLDFRAGAPGSKLPRRLVV